MIAFMYEGAPDIPEGMTIVEWRAGRGEPRRPRAWSRWCSALFRAARLR